MVVLCFCSLIIPTYATDISINFTLDGVSTEQYDKVITDNIKVGQDKSVDCSKTYLKTVQATDEITITNGHGKKIGKSAYFFLKANGNANWTTAQLTKKVSDFPTDFIVSASDLWESGFSKESISDSTATYYFLCVNPNKVNNTVQRDIFGILIQVKPTGTPATEDEIKTLSELVDAIDKNDENWYQSNDRYNGSDVITGKDDGFWNQFKAENGAYQKAKQLLSSDTITSEQIQSILPDLRKAIAKLIPKTEVNATVLYEAVQDSGGKSESQYTAATWVPFSEAKAAAETMLAELYDAETREATERNWGPKHEGTPGDDAITQSKVDAAATALTQAQGNLCLASSYGESQDKVALVSKLLPKLIAQANRAAEADYTAESWASFQTALIAANAATAPTLTGTWADKAAAAAYQKVYDDLYDAYYYRLVTANKFTVDFEVTDTSNARTNTPATGVLESAEMDAGSTLNDLVAKYAVTKHSSKYAVMINGVLVGKSYLMPRFEVTLKTGNPTLHPGDQVCLIPTFDPRSTLGATLGTIEAVPWQYLDSVKQTNFKTDADITAEAGKAFNVSVEEAYAYLGAYTGSKTPASGMTLFLSEPQTERGGKVTTTKLSADGAAIVTDANGSASLTVYREGWYLLQAYDLTEDEIGNQPNYTDEWSKGTYHSVNSGASVWLHVTASQDTGAIKTRLQEELDRVYQAYPESYFRPETWEELEAAYKTGTDGIQNADSTGDAYDAQQTAIITIQKLQSDTTAENEKNLKDFRALLNQLPDNMELITSSVKSTVEALVTSYEGMSDYQKSQLTGAEQAKYDKIAALAGELPPEQNYTLKLNIVGDSEESTKALNEMAKYFRENPAKQDLKAGDVVEKGASLLPGFGFHSYANGNIENVVTEVAPLTQIRLPIDVDYMAYYYVRDDDNHTISGDGWTIKDENLSFTMYGDPSYFSYNVEGDLTVLIGDTPYEIKSIQYEGVNARSVSTGVYTTMDYSTYHGKNKDNVNLRFADAYASFAMPYDNVTVTITWGAVSGSSDEIESAKTAAKTALKGVLDSYEKSEKYAEIKAAYDKGVAAIDVATSIEAVSTARKAALKAMTEAANGATTSKEIPGWENGIGKWWLKVSDDNEGKHTFTPGEQVGTVTVSVENRTNDGSTAKNSGDAETLKHFYTTDEDYEKYGGDSLFLYRENYPIGVNDTVMTVVLRALTEAGCTWLGTGSSYEATYNFDIGYISTITDGGYSLAEFTGGPQSGWMGTLNDWFTNEGFNNFPVADGKLTDGDVISVMYTTNGYGEDLGGTWGNSDTTLANLEITGTGNPRLASSFESGTSGGTYDYTVVIDGTSADLKLTPTAANKNFLVKTFLNEKVTSNTEGGSFYKRTETIPVVSGDVIYVGCGMRTWPTMNNQMGNIQSNDGTWYVLRIVSAVDGSKEVNRQLSELPSSDDLTYNNYEQYEKEIAEAESAYNQLKTDQRNEVDQDAVKNLEELVDKVKNYRKLKSFKETLETLPEAADATLDDSEKILAARRAYEDIRENDELYNDLTFAERNKMEDLIEKIEDLLYKDAIDKINAIGEVTKDSGEAIAAAKTAVGRLTDAQREALADKLKELAEAEKKYRELMEGKPSKPGSSGTVTRPVSPNKPKPEPAKADASKFRDVSSSDWYFDAVQYVLEKGLMNGTSDWTFAPNDATTRGMIVTILARVEGVNTNGNPWYAAGQKWAMDNDISDGTNMPGVITREQLATILYRYAKQKGYDVSKSAVLTGFVDSDKVSSYAVDAMQWAVAEELLKGSNGKLDPQGSATRAQVATILMRFMQKYEK